MFPWDIEFRYRNLPSRCVYSCYAPSAWRAREKFRATGAGRREDVQVEAVRLDLLRADRDLAVLSALRALSRFEDPDRARDELDAVLAAAGVDIAEVRDDIKRATLASAQVAEFGALSA